MKLPVAPGALRGLFKELQEDERKPLAIGGAHELARVLERELARGGDAAAVRVGDPTGAAAYVHICTGPGRDEVALRRAHRARVPIVAIQTGEGDPPYVRVTDVVRVGPGEGLPLDEIARAIASAVGEDAAPLAGRLPLLREPMCKQIIESFARKNGLVGAAVFIPGVDLPVLALNQVRMLLRLDQAFGLELDPRERLPEILAVVGAGFGLRTVARELLDFVPVAGWAVKGGVAYAGTRALGEAQLRLRLRSRP
ncbi:MAG TPA: hypothetical protein VFM96_05425 [Gaiellaceae bacterium]|nr:hypothetical protein [Gaiellaceae bacterium]